MTIWDDRILESVRKDGPKPVGELAEKDSVRISHSSVSRRCQKLAENGLLRPIGNGVYAITDEGEAYLEGEYDAENGVFLNGNGANNGPTASETTES
nr:winged helix-turn-helix domain-containing protein [Natronoarchaeum rubrum]